MKKNRNMKMAAGLLLMAGLSAPSLGADAITFDPDGPGGDAAINNVVTFDWTPGNALAVGGNAAVQNFILTGTSTDLGGGITVITGGTSTPFAVFYQAKLAGFVLVGGNPGSPLSPPGLNNTYEITAVARFDERVSNIIVDTNANTATATFAHVPSASEYLEIYFGTGTAFNASDLAGTGFNDGIKILEADLLSGPGNFVSNFGASLNLNGTQLTSALDQFSTNDYLGQLTVEGLGSTKFNGQVTAFDSAFFIDVLSTIGFTAQSEGTQGIPFNLVDPSGAFLVNSVGTALAEIPVAAGAGDPNDAIFGIGGINGQFLGTGGGNSIQLQVDAATSFQRVPGVVPEPASAALGLMGLAGLALRGRRRVRN